ncbi:MAG: ROK family protein [Acidobacteriaceae bacterium]|nr:ROK family protein [Acidobacteriaceae bacterium]
METANDTSDTQTIGVTLSGRVVAGLIADNKLAGPLHYFPEDPDDDALVELPTDGLVEHLCAEIIAAAAGSTEIAAVGVALPGFIRNGVVEEAPNLPQLKGTRIQDLLSYALKSEGFNTPVVVMNDADAVASGLAATRGQLDRLIRVWTLGIGIGYGRYPMTEGVWEGGHTVVTLEDKENYCGCGGRGHLEGVMGQRAMRLRFLDMEPEEVFEAAKQGDPRCLEFKKLWHKALAAATATTFHMAGPGKVYLTGMNVGFVDLPMLKDYVHQMVTMSPLQNYSLEVIAADAEMAEVAVIGAGVTALQMGK